MTFKIMMPNDYQDSANLLLIVGPPCINLAAQTEIRYIIGSAAQLTAKMIPSTADT